MDVAKWLKDNALWMVLVGLLFAAVAYWYYEEVLTPPAVKAQRARDARRAAYNGQPLQVGDVVGTTFWGTPAAVTWAISGGLEPGTISHLLTSQSQQLAQYCELPLSTDQDIRASFTSGLSPNPPSSWISTGGIDWVNDVNTCLSLTMATNGQIMTCTTDADCLERVSCDPTAYLSSQSSCSTGAFDQPRDCPACVPCVETTSGSGVYECQLPHPKQYKCWSEYGACAINYSTVTSTIQCPLPMPACDLMGIVDTAGNNSCAGLTRTPGAPADPRNPCTGCQPGQTCVVPSGGGTAGTCQGAAQVYHTLRTQWRAEGTVVGTTSGGEAVVKWERLQMAYPFYYSGASAGVVEWMPWLSLPPAERPVIGPEYHLGCRLLSDWMDATLTADLLGDVSNPAAPIDPTASAYLTPFYQITVCGGSTLSTEPFCTENAQNAALARSAWPLQVVMPGTAGEVWTAVGDLSQGNGYVIEKLGSAADLATLTASSGPNSVYDIPVSTTYVGIAAEVGTLTSESYVAPLVAAWTADAMQAAGSAPWQFSSGDSNFSPP